MRLLFDTHIWIKSITDKVRLDRPVARALATPRNELWVSPVSGLELLSICNRKALRSIPDTIAWMKQAIAEPFREAPLTFAIAIECGLINLPHGDPADRIIVATARVLGCTLVTSDRSIIESGLVEVLEGG